MLVVQAGCFIPCVAYFMWGLVPIKLAWLVPAHRSQISFVDFLGLLRLESRLLKAAIELEDSCKSRLRFLLVIEYRFGSEIYLRKGGSYALFQRLAGTLALLFLKRLALASLPSLDKVSRFMAHQALSA